MSQSADDGDRVGDRRWSGSVTARDLVPIDGEGGDRPPGVDRAEPARGVRPTAEPFPSPSPSRLRGAIVGWWRSRFGAQLAKEAAVIAALLLLYRLGRILGRDEAARAFENAREVLVLEDRLGIDNELAVQRAVLDETGLIRLLNRYYASVHFGAAHADTRAALESSLPRLRELLSAQGLQLTNASVSQQSGGKSQSERSSGPAAVGAAAEDADVAPSKVVSSSLLDIYA